VVAIWGEPTVSCSSSCARGCAGAVPVSVYKRAEHVAKNVTGCDQAVDTEIQCCSAVAGCHRRLHCRAVGRWPSAPVDMAG
jgi:hypothetical protein